MTRFPKGGTKCKFNRTGPKAGRKIMAFYNPRSMKLIALPAFEDNYLWLLHDGEQALVVDPGAAPPVTEALRGLGLRLTCILVTHHHADHTGGVAALREATGATVYGPAREKVPAPFTPLAGGDEVRWNGVAFQVIDTPGHTAGHIAYFTDDADGAALLFCGDTLFCGGCGRIFEGTPAQMLASLDTLAALPDRTRVCCAHEYTLSNLRFARAVEPDNAALADHERQCQALRAAGTPTVPSSIQLERAINPFLRSRTAAVTQAVRARTPAAADEVAVFAALRQWKNEFR
jgi:hydroxyacylglutathione hydrolase